MAAGPRDRRETRGPQPAWVLHRWDWSESSLIVELFVRDLGRVAAAARGAKRGNSDLRAVLMPFQPVAVAFTLPSRRRAGPAEESAAPEAEVLTLRSAEWTGGAALMPAAALLSAYYLNELLLRTLARHDPHPALFDRYGLAVGALATSRAPEQEAAVLRAFELGLLREQGLLPALDLATADGQPVRADEPYLLRADTGLGRSRHADALPGALWAAIEAALAPESDAAALTASCALGGSALRRQLRGAIEAQLASPRLRTREVWRELQQLAGPVTGAP
jgi:DNA repair protein RecO (recombination protein O)